MKKSIIQFTWAFIAIGFLMACEEPDLPHLHFRKAIVEFDLAEISISENQGHYSIKMPFNKIAPNGGRITLSVSGLDASRLRMEPAPQSGRMDLIVWENSTYAELHLMPIDNSRIDGNLSFEISIIDTCPNFAIGERSTVSVVMTDDESPSTAALTIPEGNISEKNPAGKTVGIAFSRPLSLPGSISIKLSSANAIYGTHYTTEPAATGGLINLSTPILATSASFSILPLDNSVLNGHLDLAISIEATSGPIIKGPGAAQAIQIIDDELATLPKSYSIGAGQWGLKKTFEYDQSGRIQYVRIEKSTPTPSTQTETYFYDSRGQILKINLYPQIDRVFTWTNERITKSENIDHGILKEYTDYDYDNNGNVSGAANYFRQPDGTFKLGFLNTYLYFDDGNLYKQQIYIAGDSPDQYILLSTRTFGDYLDKENPFPMVDILPTDKAQTNLPGRYTLEEHGMQLSYFLTYEYTSEGLVKKRIARNGVSSETTTYEYY